MNQEELEFVRAVRSDSYAELEIGDGLVVVTDWESDGTFLPYIVVLDEENWTEEEVDNALLENQNLFSFEGVELEEQNQLTVGNIIAPEFNHWETPDEELVVEGENE